MSMLDRLRQRAIEEDEFNEAVGDEFAVSDAELHGDRILGMNAVERMLLSILIFLATSVLGTLLLIALGRIDIGL
jgi:hypothetical protein